MISADEARMIAEHRSSCRSIWYTLENAIRKRADNGLFEYKYECVSKSEAKSTADWLHDGFGYVCNVDGKCITIKW